LFSNHIYNWFPSLIHNNRLVFTSYLTHHNYYFVYQFYEDVTYYDDKILYPTTSVVTMLHPSLISISRNNINLSNCIVGDITIYFTTRLYCLHTIIHLLTLIIPHVFLIRMIIILNLPSFIVGQTFHFSRIKYIVATK